MNDDARYLLDDLLADWHRWARGYQAVAGHGTSAMFAGAKSSSRQYDSENETTDASLHNSQMKAVDFAINELEPLYRTALGIAARNLVTGRSVWTSARLPADMQERAAVLGQARAALLVRLVASGVM